MWVGRSTVAGSLWFWPAVALEGRHVRTGQLQGSSLHYCLCAISQRVFDCRPGRPSGQVLIGTAGSWVSGSEWGSQTQVVHASRQARPAQKSQLQQPGHRPGGRESPTVGAAPARLRQRVGWARNPALPALQVLLQPGTTWRAWPCPAALGPSAERLRAGRGSGRSRALGGGLSSARCSARPVPTRVSLCLPGHRPGQAHWARSLLSLPGAACRTTRRTRPEREEGRPPLRPWPPPGCRVGGGARLGACGPGAQEGGSGQELRRGAVAPLAERRQDVRKGLGTLRSCLEPPEAAARRSSLGGRGASAPQALPETPRLEPWAPSARRWWEKLRQPRASARASHDALHSLGLRWVAPERAGRHRDGWASAMPVLRARCRQTAVSPRALDLWACFLHLNQEWQQHVLLLMGRVKCADLGLEYLAQHPGCLSRVGAFVIRKAGSGAMGTPAVRVTQEVEAGGSQLEASRGHLARSCLKVRSL